MFTVKYLYRFSAIFLMMLFIGGCSDSGTAVETGTLSVRISQGGQQASPPNKPSVSSITVYDMKIVLGAIQLINDAGDTVRYRSDDPFVALLWGKGDEHDLGAFPFPVGDYVCTIYQVKQASSTDTIIYNSFPELRQKSIYCAGYIDDNTDSVFEWSTDYAFIETYDHDTLHVRAGDTAYLDFVFDPELWYDDGEGGKYDPRNLLEAADYDKIDSNIINTFQIEVQ